MKDQTLDPGTATPVRLPYTSPRLRRESRIELVTAGSFDLLIPNAP